MRKLYLIIPLVLLMYLSCEDKKEEDTTPPTVSITSPQDSSTVSDSITITCISSDDEGVEKVELWINGVFTGLIDETEPYSFEWNTTTIEDGSYTILVRSYDTNGNTTDSYPIILLVDNSDSYPSPVNITSIEFENFGFNVKWNKSSDNDFSSYKLYESISENMDEQNLIYETNELSDTTFYVSGIDINQIRYYQIEVENEFGLQSKGEVSFGSSKISFSKIIENGIGVYVQETNDGGYIITGNRGEDILLIKTDYSGNTIWEKVYEEPYNEYGYQVEQTEDSGYIILGYGSSDNTLLIKTDEFGNQQWDKNYYGIGYFLYQTTDGEFMISGRTLNGVDGVFIKTDSNGNEIWNITFIQSPLNSFQQTTDGGYILVGSKSGESLLTKTDYNGIKEWEKIFEEGLTSTFVLQTTDGGYIFDYQVSGQQNVYLIRTDNQGNELWNKYIVDGWIRSLRRTSEGGYILLTSGIEPDPRLIKISQDGELEWNRYLGYQNTWEHGNEVQQTTDDGYIIVGTSEVSWIENNIFLMKTNSEGIID